jgi:hypothetical protein
MLICFRKMMVKFNLRATFVNMASHTTEQRAFILRVSLLFRKVQVQVNCRHFNVRVAPKSSVMNFQPLSFSAWSRMVYDTRLSWHYFLKWFLWALLKNNVDNSRQNFAYLKSKMCTITRHFGNNGYFPHWAHFWVSLLGNSAAASPHPTPSNTGVGARVINCGTRSGRHITEHRSTQILHARISFSGP